MSEYFKQRKESTLGFLNRLYDERNLELQKEKVDTKKVGDIQKCINDALRELNETDKLMLNEAAKKLEKEKEKEKEKDKAKEKPMWVEIAGLAISGVSVIATIGTVVVSHEKNKVDRYRIDSANRNLDRLGEFEQTDSIRSFTGRKVADAATKT